jgi:hypothetical protein
MRAKLGNVLFWLGIIIAVGWLLLSWFGYSTIAGSRKFDISDFLIIAVIPALIVSMGWALRYILAGTR